MIILAIDPATHGCGCAALQDDKLIAAGYARNLIKDGDPVRRSVASAKAALDWWIGSFGGKIDRLVVELPPVYTPGKGNKGDQNEIVVPLAMVDGALGAFLPLAETVSYKPHEWKGSTRKPERARNPDGTEALYVIKERVKGRLEVAELAAIDWTGSIERSWDVADAIGVGLHHLGRLGKKRVYPRD